VARGLFGSGRAGTLVGMKVSASLCVLALLVASAASAPLLLTSAAVQSADPAAELDEHMQTLQAGVKGLDKALEKKELDKALGLMVDMQKAAHQAKLGTPAKAGEVTDAKDKAKFMSGYRLKLIELEHGLLDVEAALVEGKPEDAKKALEAKVKPIKKVGHDTYKD
jgi:soluble cytochrome b562